MVTAGGWKEGLTSLRSSVLRNRCLSLWRDFPVLACSLSSSNLASKKSSCFIIYSFSLPISSGPWPRCNAEHSTGFDMEEEELNVVV